MPDKFQNKYRISSTRLPNWDYVSNGSYFITICTGRRRHYFGEIVHDEMQFSEIGLCANKCWLAIPDHFPWVYLDEFIVMPNHVHGIITIEKPFIYNSADFDFRGSSVETGHALSLPENDGTNIETGHALSLPKNDGTNIETGHALSLPENDGTNIETGHALSLPENGAEHVKPQHPRFRNQGQNTISAMVGSFKSAVTKYCNENALRFKWQSRFHDHVIRDKNEFLRIRNYIINNPCNWNRDKFFRHP